MAYIYKTLYFSGLFGAGQFLQNLTYFRTINRQLLK